MPSGRYLGGRALAAYRAARHGRIVPCSEGPVRARGSPSMWSSWGACPVTDLPAAALAQGAAPHNRRAPHGQVAPLREEILAAAARLLGERHDPGAQSVAAGAGRA